MRDGMYVGLIVALLGHVAAVGSPDYTMWMMHVAVVKMNRELAAYFKRTQDVSVVSEDEPAPDKAEEVAVPEPEPIADDPVPADEPDPVAAEEDEPEDDPYEDDEPYVAPAPLAAEAQDIMTAEDGAVDMTGDGWDIHDNDGSTSRGTGWTGRKGRKDGHVGNPRARSDGTRDGKGTAKPRRRTPSKDLSRAASVVGGNWGCPFPPQADLNQVDRAAVTLSISVGANGRARSASVMSDPGYGFGAQARRCAMSKRYSAARNRAGKKITKTIVVRVTFKR